jgi:prolyl oligopeptidase
MSISKSCDPVNQLWFYDLRKSNFEIKPNMQFSKLVDNFDAKYDFVTNEGSTFTFKTNQDAPNYKLVSVDLSESTNWKFIDLVKERPDDVLEEIVCVNRTKLLLNYMHDCKNELYLYDLLTGAQLKKFNIDIGSILELSGHKKQNFFFYKFGSFTTPGDIFHVKFNEEVSLSEPSLFRSSQFKGLDLNQFKTEQIFYKSKDGTSIPMFLVSKKSIQKAQNNPVFLYGYGGFNISLTPTFSVVRLIWLYHFNGIYACANLRGGGEYGEKWYNSGRLLNKQNTFDDFVSAAEYLIENEYTNKDR